MRKLDYLHFNFASSDIHVLVSSVTESLFVTIRSTSLNKQVDLIKCLLGLRSLTHVAFRSCNLALSFALITLLLELLDKTRGYLLRGHDDTLTFALVTCLDVVGIVSATSSAVGANHVPCVLNFHLFATVEVFQ